MTVGNDRLIVGKWSQSYQKGTSFGEILWITSLNLDAKWTINLCNNYDKREKWWWCLYCMWRRHQPSNTIQSSKLFNVKAKLLLLYRIICQQMCNLWSMTLFGGLWSKDNLNKEKLDFTLHCLIAMLLQISPKRQYQPHDIATVQQQSCRYKSNMLDYTNSVSSVIQSSVALYKTFWMHLSLQRV